METEVTFFEDRMIISRNGVKVILDVREVSTRLFEASEEERILYKISPSGYGIHWPMIDEDISVKELVKDHE
ncbi:DUF2442 domain-containing protein [Algoriphagus zhangzhouensis]|uniref:DUF2442 domain-containing protein n=1 Tax=Algoriphagus zhangzhouensis TaxID=1073327 RepID=A0A1M7ZIN4_9BACT|nr:DUF2442 domain-containing protein [Algoriphagus zhangzhouensis]TDY43743.1 uncharacterized protein DUF2442 [Algoriphagus zhangzhouensis]SHO64734.1 Protein of unknown function [Algoriphagus zhangzhouensis]